MVSSRFILKGIKLKSFLSKKKNHCYNHLNKYIFANFLQILLIKNWLKINCIFDNLIYFDRFFQKNFFNYYINDWIFKDYFV